jgi:2-haloacid dehalogenase
MAVPAAGLQGGEPGGVRATGTMTDRAEAWLDIEIIAFDMFGTLVDWRSSISAALARVGERAGLTADWAAIADSWRSRYQPALGKVIRGERSYQPLDVLHAGTLEEVVAEFGLDRLGAADRDELVHAWYELAPWPDAVPGLTALHERYKLAPLSNGGVGLLARLAKTAGFPFDCILSAELAGTYKPDPRVYRLAPDYFSVRPDQVLMVACHPSDLDGAKRAGLRTGYVPRPLEWGPAGSAPPPPGTVDLVADDMNELARLI